jgi:ornithine decarboxylase
MEAEFNQVQVLNEPLNIEKMINKLTSNGSENQEDPFYIFNIDDIIAKYRHWIMRMPRVNPYYAVKCNDNPVVLSVLRKLGTSFDCASKGEIDKVLNLGANANDIIFANPAKSKAAIVYAKLVGVKMMTFDCELELHKINALYPDAE